MENSSGSLISQRNFLKFPLSRESRSENLVHSSELVPDFHSPPIADGDDQAALPADLGQPELARSNSQSMSAEMIGVEAFRQGPVKAKTYADPLKKVFEKTERWTLARNASEIIRSMKLPPKVLIYAQCAVTRERTPFLDVRPIRKQAQSA